jgi:cell division protein FtsA
MMNSGALVAGLDVGTTKVCAVIAERNEWGQIKILGLGQALSTGVARGVVLNIEHTMRAIQQAVQEAERMAGVEVKALYVGIAGEHVQSLINRAIITIRSEEIRENDVRRLTEEAQRLALPPDRQILHILPQEFIVDNRYAVQNPVGMAGLRLEGVFLVVTGLVTAIRNLQRCVERAGYEVADIVLQPFASGMAVLDPEEQRAGVALIDIGGGTTDVAVFEDNTIRYMAVVPFGGNKVTDDLRHALQLLPEQAESLKLHYGCARTDLIREVAQITIPGISGRPPRTIEQSALAHFIQASMEEILDRVYEELKRSGYMRRLTAGVVLTGGGALLRGLPELVSDRLELEARLGLPVGIHAGIVDEIRSPKYATGVGLIRYAFDLSAQEGMFIRSARDTGASFGDIFTRVWQWLRRLKDNLFES